ncbi:MAG: ABC transporter permease [Chloroflexi bacterium]|nr:ABC transporter permease [Chloroflexota bacterium]
MIRYVVRRLLLTLPVLWGVSLIVFIAIRMVPGDVILAKMQGEFSARPEQIAQMRAELGLDLPGYVQYARWIVGVLHGDFGTSMNTFRPVLAEIASRIPITAELAILSLLFGTLIAVPIGVASAVYQDTWIDYLGRVLAMLALSVPSFVIATSLILFPSLWWGYFPPLGLASLFQDPLTNLQQVIPATIALGAILAGQIMRLTRSSVLEVLRSDFVRTARAKGLSGMAIVSRHVLKASLIPVVTLIGSDFGRLLGGTVIIEAIFAFPGMGLLTLTSIQLRDYTQLQGNVLFIATVFVLFNLAIDLFYGVLDPRVRYR